MNKWIGAAAFALLIAGCNTQEGANSGNAAAGGAAPGQTVQAPNGGDWTEAVRATDDGGFLMGNPNAPVKLIEYASLTCPHCAEFAEQGEPQLIEKYVKTGQVSFELRNFIRDSADVAAALISRCRGAGPYFKLTEQLFAAQSDWLGRLQTISQTEQQRLAQLPTQQVPLALAESAGLIQFAKVRGIPEAQARACLTDEAAMEKLAEMANVAQTRFQLQGTPTFVINGNTVANAADWKTLEPRLQEALR